MNVDIVGSRRNVPQLSTLMMMMMIMMMMQSLDCIRQVVAQDCRFGCSGWSSTSEQGQIYGFKGP